MARLNTHVQDCLFGMREDGVMLDAENETSFWRKVFLSGVFKSNLSTQFWIIDGLDECTNIGPFLDTMLGSIDTSLSLKILLVSRDSTDLKRKIMGLGTYRIRHHKLSLADTLPDIKQVVMAKADSIFVEDYQQRAAIIDRVLAKSEGSFLWTTLTMNKLASSYGEQEINGTIENLPHDMKSLYQRALDVMAQNTNGKKLARAVLVWATCAVRPLTTKELDLALQLDVRDKFPKLDESIPAVCGHLIVVDKFDRVQVVHETLREFLLEKDLDSEFAISKMEAHTSIARACLAYLAGDDMKPPRTGRRGPAAKFTAKKADFADYACMAFSLHLTKADAFANDVFKLTEKFLHSNVLSWIEFIAQTHNLMPLVQTARHLKSYHNHCAAARSPLGVPIRVIGDWATDLNRIVAKFASALTTSPLAIYALIPPFCPEESAIRKTIASARKLSVAGLTNNEWDDRVMCIDYRERQPSAVAYGEKFIAVGLTTGAIILYDAASGQEHKALMHGEAVRLVRFGDKARLVSCGLKIIRVWEPHSGEQIRTFEAPRRAMDIAFDEHNLLVASSTRELAAWDLEREGVQLPNRSWHDSVEKGATRSGGSPCAVSVSVPHRMLAVAYRTQRITLWDIEEDVFFGNCGKKDMHGNEKMHMVTALVFNPNPNVELLAASYLDGQLLILDPCQDNEVESLRANCHTLAASPNGRLLAGASGAGAIQIFEYDSLRLLYRIQSANFFVKQLAFSDDSLRLADIRGSHCNVWEPAGLLGQSTNDDTSSERTLTPAMEVIASPSKAKISAISLHVKGDVTFCGKDNGSICVYSLKTGTEVRTLHGHKTLVRLICFRSESDIVYSVDASNKIFAWHLTYSRKDGWGPGQELWRTVLSCGNSISHLMLGEPAQRMILTTRHADHLWSTEGHQIDVRTDPNDRRVRMWSQHPTSPLHVICIVGTVVQIHAWEDWSSIESVSLAVDVTGLQLKRIIPLVSAHKTHLLLEWSELDGSPATSSMHLFGSAAFETGNSTVDHASDTSTTCPADDGKTSSTQEALLTAAQAMATPLLSPQLTILSRYVAHVVGFCDASHLVFLDTRSWICSINIEGMNERPVAWSRHFFIPYDWFAGTRDILCAVAQRDVLFVRNDQLAIVKGGLDYVDTVYPDNEEVYKGR
ncbi:MAG: hypothetical protein OHK93_004979 [Ramalina farinacea]|uniref:Uncharacterized protein n=1 Tax=Ramalina farinacea TaxID=258253 RepID=A0AA43QV52_9LECA|nr:hypothetical protein [Ramalina farinacea]